MAKAARFTETKGHLMSMIAQAGGSDSQQVWLAHVIILVHLAGGFFLALGLWTRTAALVQIPILAGAVIFVELRKFAAPELRGNFDLAVLVLFLLVMIAAFGPGRLSVDAWRGRKSAQAGRKTEP